MPKVEKSIIVPFSQQQMFELVNDVDAYWQFLPFCTHSEVLESSDAVLKGALTLAKGGLKKTFVTCNQLTPFSKMRVALVEGPFKTLEGVWQFQALKEGYTQVHLNMHYEFDSAMLAMVFGPLFSQVANSLVDAFCQRAKEIYQ